MPLPSVFPFPGALYVPDSVLIPWSRIRCGSRMGSVPWQRLTPVRLVLAGRLSALLSALSEGIALYFQVGQDMAFWYAGGTAGIKWVHLKIIAVDRRAILGAIALSRSITMLSLGDEIARGLGANGSRQAGRNGDRAGAGRAVSVVGAVGFVGLMIPHVTRKLVGGITASSFLARPFLGACWSSLPT